MTFISHLHTLFLCKATTQSLTKPAHPSSELLFNIALNNQLWRRYTPAVHACRSLIAKLHFHARKCLQIDDLQLLTTAFTAQLFVPMAASVLQCMCTEGAKLTT